MEVASPFRLVGDWHRRADIWIRSGWRVCRDLRTGRCRLEDPWGRRVMVGSAEESIEQGRRLAPPSNRPAAVVLLHGLARTRRCMAGLEAAALEAGFAVANVGYPSLALPISAHAGQVAGIAAALAEDGAATIHVIGHSLGGLIARQAMAQGLAARGRLVTIGTPNGGASVADRLLSLGAYRRFFGPCGAAVTTAAAVGLPVPEAEIAVIAGGNGRRGYNPLLRGDNDGLVTVAETRLAGQESDFVLVPNIHSLLMTDGRSIRSAMRFLSTGRLSG